MNAKEFITIGRGLGHKMLETRIAEPSPLEKAIGLIIGILAVMKQAGVRVTVPMLEESDDVTKAFGEYGLPIDKLKTAVREANKRWKDEGEHLLRVDGRRRKPKNESASPLQVVARTSATHEADVPKSATATQKPRADQNDMFVDDMPSEAI